MHSTLDLCQRPAREETNAPQYIRDARAYCPNIYSIYCALYYNVAQEVNGGES